MWRWLFVVCVVSLAAAQDPLAILKQMTQEEKYSLLRGIGWVGSDPADGYYVGNVPPIPRLGVPSLNMQDGPQGFRTYVTAQIDEVTSWPCSLAMAATWDVNLAELWGEAMGAEFSAKGANVILGPAMDICRVAKAGRTPESLSGEEGFLGGAMGPAVIRGLSHQRVMGVMKHYIANNQETNRTEYNAVVSSRALHEVYYWPFRSAIQTSPALAAMCSYNRINGAYACENAATLTGDLKGRMGLSGFVMSDWWATHTTSAALAGLDQEQPGDPDDLFSSGEGPYFTPPQLSHVPNATIDQMTYRILLAMTSAGIFQNCKCSPPNCDDYLYNATGTSKEHQKLAREIAGSSIVLLKNDDNTLPIDKTKVSRIALIGSACDAPNPVSDIAWNQGSYYVVGGSGRVLSTRTASILEGFNEALQGTSVHLIVDLSDNVTSSLQSAEDVDVIFICGGTTSTESMDRTSLHVDQQKFISKFLAADVSNTPKVSLLLVPGVVLMPWAHKVHSIVSLFLGGEATGYAMADIVFGDVNPSGKLPITFVSHESAAIQPCLEEDCPYSEGIFVGYRGYSPSDVSFPFGHGLSYTSFSLSLLNVSVVSCGPSTAVACFVISVRNTGIREGAEVVQMYVTFPEEAGEPKVLRGFQKVFLRPNEQKVLSLSLSTQDVSIWEEDHWRKVSGVFTADFGTSFFDIVASTQFVVS